MIDFTKIYESQAEQKVGSREILEGNTAKYNFKKTPIDIQMMQRAGAIEQQFARKDDFERMTADTVCDYVFNFDFKFASANGTVVVPKPFEGDECHIKLIRKAKRLFWNDSYAAMWTTVKGEFKRGWVFDADLDKILTVWIYGTTRSDNQSMSPQFLLYTFGGRQTFDAAKSAAGLLTEKVYDNNKVIDLITNERFRHLHVDHQDRCDALKEVIMKQNGFVGNPVIVCEYTQRRDHVPNSFVLTDQNYLILFERRTNISDGQMFDIFKVGAAYLIRYFYQFRENILEQFNRPFGQEISKKAVQLAIADEIAGLVF